mmetsp:Transcript_11396/g.28809  ORF Transcript_11396/g.28809 Transcript_11396/m.28809 type:complete len:204 (-) Transcript_11396:318-929(-)
MPACGALARMVTTSESPDWAELAAARSSSPATMRGGTSGWALQLRPGISETPGRFSSNGDSAAACVEGRPTLKRASSMPKLCSLVGARVAARTLALTAPDALGAKATSAASPEPVALPQTSIAATACGPAGPTCSGLALAVKRHRRPRSSPASTCARPMVSAAQVAQVSIADAPEGLSANGGEPQRSTRGAAGRSGNEMTTMP